MIILLVQQRFAQPQFMQNDFIRFALAVLLKNRFAEHGFGHLLLDGQIGCSRETAIVIDRRINWQIALSSEEVILEPVAWRDVDKTCAGHVFNEGITSKQSARARTERMLILKLAKVAAIQAANDLITVPAALFRYHRQQHRCPGTARQRRPRARHHQPRRPDRSQLGRSRPASPG